VHSAALQFLRNGVVLPEVLHCPDGDYINRWIPALQIDSVNTVVQSLARIIPSHLIKWFIHEEEYFCSPVDAVISLCSLILGHYIAQWNLNSNNTDFFDTFLTSNKPYPFEEFSEREIPAAFQQWLSNLYLTSAVFHPVITVSESAQTVFGVTLDIETTGKNGSDLIPYAAFIKSGKHAMHRLPVMRVVSLIGTKLPVVHAYLRNPNVEVELSGEEIIPFLEAVAPVMRLTQMRVTLPKSLQHLVRPRVTGHFTTKQRSSGFLSLYALLAFDWRIALGDSVVTLSEFRKLLESNSRLVRYRDQYIILNEKEVAAILRRIEKPAKFSAPEMLRSVILGEFEGIQVSLSQEILEQLKSLRQISQLKTPSDLHASLRPYQARGYAWLYKNARLGLGSILADDMGLGKTLQVLTLLLKFKHEGALKKKKALVIAPSTLLTNWERECEKFTPSLKTHIYHGASRSFQDADYDLLFTTYGLIRQDQQAFAKMTWAVIVIDEAQAIKNPSTAQAKAVHALKSPVKIAMSGTPVENRLMEYFSIFHFTNPGYLGTANHFKKTYANPIERNRDQDSLDQFRRVTEPFIMRRMKTDKSIISDLPDKTEMNRYCVLTKVQTALYASITKKIMKEIEQSEGIARRGLVLQLLLKLKQVCNHPYNHLKSGSRDIALTGKGESVVEVINAVKEEGSKVLIFTQFKEMGDVLVHMLSALGEKAFFLHGGLSRKSRDEMVSQFQEQPYPRVLILSIKAGGTGLNLTAATHVIHYDLWWNPAVERQATDRAFRIGQKHKVTVHRMITQHTLEEKIDAMIQSKKELADLTVVSGEKWIGELSNKELEKLVTLE
jgi:superfamily II DNA or RNA helicase